MGRTLDVIGAVGGLLVLSPVFLLTALAVKASDGGPILYRATRVGCDGKLFDMLKFRTMVVDADISGPGITTSGDPRVTPVGRFLRKSKMDELPQLINVLRGDMSMVGPRPEDPRYVESYTHEQRRILAVRPGMTSAASLKYHDEESLLSGENWEIVYRSEVLPAKIEIDLEYIDGRSAAKDLQIVLRTLVSLFR